jgi:hypothetical protein
MNNQYSLREHSFIHHQNSFMITITNYFVRENKEGQPFVALELTGDLEMIQSTQTGKFYATAKRCSISSVFSEPMAKSLIGKQLPLSIERVTTAPYEYKVERTGETLLLSHTYVYQPVANGQAIEQPAEAVTA